MRLRLLGVAGRIIATGRRQILPISEPWPWAELIPSGHPPSAAHQNQARRPINPKPWQIQASAS